MRKAPVLLAQALPVALFLASLLAILALRGFPAFEHGRPALLTAPPETNEELIYLMWGDRFPDLVAQASLVVLAAAACVSAVRLWRRGA